MSESTDRDNTPIDWHRLLLRKDRPLPKRGCSVAFYIFMALLLAALIIMWTVYKKLF